MNKHTCSEEQTAHLDEHLRAVYRAHDQARGVPEDEMVPDHPRVVKLLDRIDDVLETKAAVRHVRTAAGARKYGVSIGTLIGSNGKPVPDQRMGGSHTSFNPSLGHIDRSSGQSAPAPRRSASQAASSIADIFNPPSMAASSTHRVSPNADGIHVEHHAGRVSVHQTGTKHRATVETGASADKHIDDILDAHPKIGHITHTMVDGSGGEHQYRVHHNGQIDHMAPGANRFKRNVATHRRGSLTNHLRKLTTVAAVKAPAKKTPAKKTPARKPRASGGGKAVTYERHSQSANAGHVFKAGIKIGDSVHVLHSSGVGKKVTSGKIIGHTSHLRGWSTTYDPHSRYPGTKIVVEHENGKRTAIPVKNIDKVSTGKITEGTTSEREGWASNVVRAHQWRFEQGHYAEVSKFAQTHSGPETAQLVEKHRDTFPIGSSQHTNYGNIARKLRGQRRAPRTRTSRTGSSVEDILRDLDEQTSQADCRDDQRRSSHAPLGSLPERGADCVDSSNWATTLIAILTGLAGVVAAGGGLLLAIRAVHNRGYIANVQHDMAQVSKMLEEERQLRLNAELTSYQLRVLLAKHGISTYGLDLPPPEVVPALEPPPEHTRDPPPMGDSVVRPLRKNQSL